MMKAIIIGASLSGKTSIIKRLKKKIKVPISEVDEELTNLNGGIYPDNTSLKNAVLTPEIIKNILSKKEIIFFTNTDYFNVNDLKKAKRAGFKIIQLNIDLENLIIRNRLRIKEENYPDMSKWLSGMVKYQKKIKNLGLLDAIIDANEPLDDVVKKLLQVIA